MKATEIVIEKLREEHIDGVMEISESEFGHLYKKSEKFRHDIYDENVAVHVAVIDGRVVGFSRCVIFGPDKIDELLKIPDSREKDFLSTKKKILLLDAFAIKESEQGKGIGSRLFDSAISEFKHDIAVGMLWKNCKNGKINAHPLFVKWGFTPTELDIQGYWNLMVDEPEGHYCPVCGAPPDRCGAVLYYREI